MKIRKLLIAVLVISLSILLAACSKKAVDTPADPSNSSGSSQSGSSQSDSGSVSNTPASDQTKSDQSQTGQSSSTQPKNGDSSATASDPVSQNPTGDTSHDLPNPAEDNDTADGPDDSDFDLSEFDPLRVEFPETPVQIAASIRRMNYDYEDKDDLGTIASAKFDSVLLSDPWTYRKLSDSLESHSELIRSTIQSYYATVRNLALEAYENDKTKTTLPYFVEYQCSVPRCDTLACSLVEMYMLYTGGVHPEYWYSSVVYDSKTGKVLTLSDILSASAKQNYTQVANLIEKILLEDFPEINYTKGSYYDYFLNMLANETVSWSLDYDGISLYFSPYTLGAYALGSQTIKLPFAGNELLFNPVYMQIPVSYTVAFNPEARLACDLNRDGNVEYLNYWNRSSGPFDESDLSIYLTENFYYDSEKDASYRSIIHEWDLCPVLVHTASGKDYLYFAGTAESDMHSVNIFKIENNKISYVDAAAGNVELYSFNDFLTPVTGVFDPSNFAFVTRSDILGTTFELNYYHVGDNGMPVPEYDYYYINSDEYVLVLKQELETVLVNEDGTVFGDKIVLQPGSTVIVLRGDRKGSVDFITPEGLFVRVTLEDTDNDFHYYHLINGVDVDEYFFGVRHAG